MHDDLLITVSQLTVEISCYTKIIRVWNCDFEWAKAPKLSRMEKYHAESIPSYIASFLVFFGTQVS